MAEQPVVIHDDAYRLLLRHFKDAEAFERWLQRKVPALGNVTPLEYVRGGAHSWADVLNIMERGFSLETTA